MKNFIKLITLIFILCINIYAQWVQPMGAVGSFARSVSTDVDGNVFVIGHFEDRIQMDEATILTNLGYQTQDVFIGKFDPEGNLLWAHNIGGLDSDIGFGIVTDLNGNCFITGSYNGPANFDSTTVLDGSGAFIAKYNSGGKLQWANKINSSPARGTGVATNSNGDIFGIGVFFETANFMDAAILTSYGGNDLYLVKYDSDGILKWANQIGSTHTDEGAAVTTDNNGNVLVTGYFTGTAFFDSSTTLTGTNGINFSDAFIAAYNSNGVLQWVNQGGGKSNGNGITTNSDNNIFVTGSFSETINIDSTTALTSTGFSDIFILKYSSDGSLQWAKQAGADGGLAEGQGISTDANGNIFATGYFSATANFDANTTLTSNSGIENAFFVKYDPAGNVEWANKVGTSGSAGSGVSLGYGIDTDKEGNVLVAGSFHGEAQFDESTSFISLGSKADAFVAKYSGTDGSLVTGLNDENLHTNPLNFNLAQNYPNPFNPSTKISFNIPTTENVRVTIYDLLGKKVAILVDEIKQAGNHQVSWNGTNQSGGPVNSGIYFYQLKAGKQAMQKRMLLLK